MDNLRDIYLYIIAKQTISEYAQISMPAHYGGTERDESRMGYAVLKSILTNEFNLPYNPAGIQVSTDGKPYLIDSRLKYNISNCDRYIACAVGYQELGVDIEGNRTMNPRLLGKVLTAQERDHSINPLQAWVTKEAYSKMTGQGLKLGFSDLSARGLRDRYPNIAFEKWCYFCVLFYSNPDARVHVRYSIGRGASGT